MTASETVPLSGPAGPSRARWAAFTSVADAADAIARAAVDLLPGVTGAGVSRLRNGRLSSAGTTGAAVDATQQLQYRSGEGPTIDTIVLGGTHVAHDLASDDRWPDFGPKAARSHGLRSALSCRLRLDGADDQLVTTLDCFGAGAGDLDEVAGSAALDELVTYAAMALWGAVASEDAHGLLQALDSNRTIGTAVGILMQQRQLTERAAFELLRRCSQNSNCKIRDIAQTVVDTGALPAVPTRNALRARPRPPR